MIRTLAFAALASLFAAPALAEEKTAVFAGGCFWCVEHDFEKVPGVLEAVSGFTGGHLDDPTYEQVSHHATGHLEAVEVTYDDAVVSYGTLVEYFWRNVDPTDAEGQFCDKGPSYVTAIFVDGDAQRGVAEASKAALEASGAVASVQTTIRDLDRFWSAETYHQDYSHKNPLRYRFYRATCGRDHRLEQVWGDEAGGAGVLEAAGLM